MGKSVPSGRVTAHANGVADSPLADIGHFYLAEMLFLRGVSPWRSVGEVADLDKMVALARRPDYLLVSGMPARVTSL